MKDRAVVLCQVHAKSETKALALARKPFQWRTDDAQRIAALEKLAAETKAHENAPSPAIVKRLAEAFPEGSPAIRKRVIELLEQPQHAEECLLALLGAYALATQEYSTYQANQAKELLEEKPTSDVGEYFGRWRARNVEDSKRLNALTEARSWLLPKLAVYSDDRIVSVLVAGGACEKEEVAIIRALGSQSALEGLLALLEAQDLAIAALEREIADLRAGKVPAGRPELRGASQVESKARREGAIRTDELSVITLNKKRNEYEATLRQMAVARDVKPPETVDAAGWREWTKTNIAAFPAKLPGVQGPFRE